MKSITSRLFGRARRRTGAPQRPGIGAGPWGLGLLCAVGLTACGTPREKPACCVGPAPAAERVPLSDASLYQVESEWTTDTGQRIKLTALQGRPQVVVMFFASCQYACPILVHDLTRIEAALPAELRGQTGFTLVTFDTQRDTPEALAKFRKLRQLPANWTLLHGVDADVLELAALLGVKYKLEANGQFAHSNLITVLNSQGEIVQQLSGLGQDIQPVVQKLRELLATEPDGAE